MVANTAFQAAGAEPNSRAAPSTGPDTKAGSPPIPDGASIMPGNILLNMYGWNCSAASNSQTTPSAICRTRRGPEDSRSAAQARSDGRAARRSWTAGKAWVAADGKRRVANAAAEPAAATHRPGPPRAKTMESPPISRMVRVSWMSR